jgi:ATP diphosphatase
MDRPEPPAALAALLALMARLRDPEGGCPWDQAQDFRTIAPYTIEEAYEVRDAIERGDAPKLREELGDLLFQVVFHARMAEERGWFDFAAVAAGIHEKLVRRHPHVFGAGAPPAQASRAPAGEAARNASDTAQQAAERSWQWDEIKARERAASGAADRSTLADLPLGLPALLRASKLGRRAARVGFDWQRPEQVRAKVLEELGELDAALAASGGVADAHGVEEFGDVLFALVNWSRHLGIDAEEALRRASDKFERRFRRMERLAGGRGLAPAALSPEAWEALWCEAKASD